MVGLPVEECVLFESDTLYVGVDISPLCRGHVLLITREHYFNFYELPWRIKKEVQKLQNCLRKLYKEIYGKNILFFEHGSNKPGTAGSSIDHAHLHCIPFDGDVKETLDVLLGMGVECDILKESEYKNEFSYVYIDDGENKIIYKVENLDSQFLRRILTEQLHEQDYLWQEKCLNKKSIVNLEKTIVDLKGKVTSKE